MLKAVASLQAVSSRRHRWRPQRQELRRLLSLTWHLINISKKSSSSSLLLLLLATRCPSRARLPRGRRRSPGRSAALARWSSRRRPCELASRSRNSSVCGDTADAERAARTHTQLQPAQEWTHCSTGPCMQTHYGNGIWQVKLNTDFTFKNLHFIIVLGGVGDVPTEAAESLFFSWKQHRWSSILLLWNRLSRSKNPSSAIVSRLLFWKGEDLGYLTLEFPQLGQLHQSFSPVIFLIFTYLKFIKWIFLVNYFYSQRSIIGRNANARAAFWRVKYIRDVSFSEMERNSDHGAMGVIPPQPLSNKTSNAHERKKK